MLIAFKLITADKYLRKLALKIIKIIPASDIILGVVHIH